MTDGLSYDDAANAGPLSGPEKGGIMRKLLPFIAVLLAACGSSSSSNNSGPTYAVKDSAVAYDSGSSCPITGSATTVGATVAIVNVTDYTAPTACASMQASTVPVNHVAAGLLIVRADFLIAGGTVAAPPLTPGTYAFFDLATLAPPANKIPPFDSQGKAVFFTGAMATCGATTGPAPETKINGGTVTITAADAVAGTISGSVNATLVGGGSLTGSFATTSGCTLVALPNVCTAIANLSLNLPPPSCI